MRFSILLVGVAAFLTLAIPASLSPAVADDAATCIGGSGDEQIAACTRAIASGRWSGSDLAWAYGAPLTTKRSEEHTSELQSLV